MYDYLFLGICLLKRGGIYIKQEKKVRTTRLMLAQSLKNCMSKKTFSKITINDIVEDCDLNRNTFYYHFQDTAALLKWMLEEEAISIIKQFDMIPQHKEALLFMFQYIDNNKHIINCALDSVGREALKDFFHDDFFAITQKVVNDTEELLNATLKKDYKNFISELYTNALAEMLVDYIKSRENGNHEKLISYYTFTIRSSLLGIISEYVKYGGLIN